MSVILFLKWNCVIAFNMLELIFKLIAKNHKLFIKKLNQNIWKFFITSKNNRKIKIL